MYDASDTASTSARKIEFDAAQLQYLLAQRAIKESDAAHSSLAALSRSYGDIATHLQDFKLDDPYVSLPQLILIDLST